MSARCEACGAIATVSVDRNEERAWYCETCFATHEPVAGLADLIAHMQRPRGPGNRCPHCGWTAQQTELTGRVGCPLCYEALDSDLLESFERQTSISATSG